MASLRGVRVIITAGGTREAIDPVRFLGNRSSGKMGNALAMVAQQQGADVILITTVAPPAAPGIAVMTVETAADMLAAVTGALAPGAVLIMAAAVADYRPAAVAPAKLKKVSAGITLRLIPTVDVLTTVVPRARELGMFVVGFAAETDDLIDNASAKLHDKGLDLIVVNDVSQPGIGMGADDNAITMLDAGGVIAEVARAPKPAIAAALLDAVALRRREA